MLGRKTSSGRVLFSVLKAKPWVEKVFGRFAFYACVSPFPPAAPKFWRQDQTVYKQKGQKPHPKDVWAEQ